MKKIFVLSILSIFLISGLASAVVNPEKDNLTEVTSSEIPGEYVVIFKDGHIKLITEETVRNEKFNGNVKSYLEMMKTNPLVDFIQPNFRYFIMEKIPNDSLYTTNQKNMITIKAPQAWDYSTGSDVVVAVLDTGIDYNHSDLKLNLWTNFGEIMGNNIDDDNNGLIDDFYGSNFSLNTPNGDPLDDNGHGTHCAGIIGSVGNNGYGVVGVNWNIKIMGVKFISPNGSGTTLGAYGGLQYILKMKQRGENIVAVNCSFGGNGKDTAMETAIKNLKSVGVLVVVAAGNDGTNNDIYPKYPANFSTTCDNVITVAAIDNNGNKASFSNYGSNTVHLAAPGVEITSTYPNNQFVSMSGTSMSTPHVTGSVALVYSVSPSPLSYLQIKNFILQNTTYINSMNGKTITNGMLNLYNAVLAVTPGVTPTPTLTPTPTPTPTPTITNVPTITPTPSDVTLNLTPSNGSITKNDSITISWKPVNWTPTNGTYYMVYGGKSNNPPLLGTTYQTTVKLIGLVDKTTYYWKIVAKTGSMTVVSPVYSFITQFSNNGIITLSSPSGTITTVKPKYTWVYIGSKKPYCYMIDVGISTSKLNPIGYTSVTYLFSPNRKKR